MNDFDNTITTTGNMDGWLVIQDSQTNTADTETIVTSGYVQWHEIPDNVFDLLLGESIKKHIDIWRSLAKK